MIETQKVNMITKKQTYVFELWDDVVAFNLFYGGHWLIVYSNKHSLQFCCVVVVDTI